MASTQGIIHKDWEEKNPSVTKPEKDLNFKNFKESIQEKKYKMRRSFFSATTNGKRKRPKGQKTAKGYVLIIQ